MLTIQNKKIDIENKHLICNIEYPVIQNNSCNILVQNINQKIYEDIIVFKDININQQIEQKYNLLMFINYEVTLNKNNLVSIPIVFSESTKYNRIISYINTYNYDINNNTKINLKDIFKNEFDFKSYINQSIENKTQERFKGITDNQDFYITPNSIVICFSSYELYSDYPGIEELEIDFKKIKDNLSEYAKKQIME